MTKIRLSLLLAGLLLVAPLKAGEAGSQVPVINPTPQSVNVDSAAGSVDVSSGVYLVDKSGLFRNDVAFLQEGGKKNVKLTVEFGEKKASKAGVAQVSGAYLLKVDKKGIKVTGYDERGAFYGLQTLRQMVEASTVLPYIEINDWPDLPARGVVEGFYGNPWSHQARLSLIDFYGRYKMDTYIYGPKDDPYHSSPNWRLPYPEDEAAQLSELVEACKRNRVNFVWAIHPGQDIKWNEEDYGNLLSKLNMMYDLGIRAFALFFDDISGEGAHPMRQVELLNRLNVEFVQAKGDVDPLIICPTDYNRSWANPTERGSLAVYGRELDPSVRVFWTGDYVCSNLTPSTLQWVGERIKRPALYWWNFPVTDYCMSYVLQGPVYGLDTGLTAENLCGFVSNPMEHAEASKLALYGVADYTWNIADYNPKANWERGLAVLAGEKAAAAYRTFAIHSCDTETGYRREESWETETFRVAEYTPEQYEALMADYVAASEAYGQLKADCNNAELMRELTPWLVEFEKLGQRGVRTLELLKVYESGDDAAFWKGYVENLMTKEQKDAYEKHKSGSMKLQPFYENAMDDMVLEFYRRVSGRSPYTQTAIGSFANIGTVSGKLMFDEDTTSFYTSGYAQRTDDWIGVDLGFVRSVTEIDILQGRNSVDDVDYFDNTVLETSKDGDIWYPLLDSLERQYIIRWTGDGVDARYVRIRKLPSSKTNWAAVRNFSVNPLRASDIEATVTAPDMERAVYAFDNNPFSSYRLNGTLSFAVPEGSKGKITVLAKHAAPVTVKQYNNQGAIISRKTYSEAYCEIPISERTARISVEGETEIFEIL